MSVTLDIVRTYRSPRKVMDKLLSMGQREDRALAFLMGAAIVMFIARWPVRAREAHETGGTLTDFIQNDVYAMLLLFPLVMYFIAAVVRILAILCRGHGSFYTARVATFWSLLAASPLALLNGLVGGFVGPSPALTGVGLVWVIAFGVFWSLTMIEAERSGEQK